MKTNELTGAWLDYWVSQALFARPGWDLPARYKVISHSRGATCYFTGYAGQDRRIIYSPSTKWEHGGPIIESARIDLTNEGVAPNHSPWSAYCEGKLAYRIAGDTALIAAMRAYVASKFGEEVSE